MSDSTRALLDALPDGVIGDRGGFVIYANPSARRSLGYQGEEDLFWRPTEEIVHPSEREQVRALIDGAANGDVIELRMLRRTGEVVPVEVRAVDSELDGERARILIVRDLSERRRMEKQLQRADRMASLGTLSAGVAHEINNPLTYVLANLEMLAELLEDDGALAGPDATNELRELVAETREGAMRVHSVVRELKSYAGPQSDTKAVAIALAPVVRAVMRMATPQIKHRAELVVELGDTPRVRANPNQLHQVLLNLVVNAAQSIEIGDVRNNHIRVSTSVDARGDVLIEIADTGCGIEPASVSRIFDPFYTTKDQGEGSGLGLWICHTLIAQLGGSIAVDSIVDRGTTFRITLPAAEP